MVGVQVRRKANQRELRRPAECLVEIAAGFHLQLGLHALPPIFPGVNGHNVAMAQRMQASSPPAPHGAASSYQESHRNLHRENNIFNRAVQMG